MKTSEQALHAFEDGRLTGVFLANGYTVDEDPDYGPCVGYEEVFALTEQVAVALALRPGRLRGVEFQYLRKALQWPRTEVARRFGRTELTVTNWESRNKVPLEASLLMKQNCLHQFGYDIEVRRVLDQQGETEFSDTPIIMRFAEGGQKWSSNFHPKAHVVNLVQSLTPALSVHVKSECFERLVRTLKPSLGSKQKGLLVIEGHSKAVGERVHLADKLVQALWSVSLESAIPHELGVSESFNWPPESSAGATATAGRVRAKHPAFTFPCPETRQ